MNTPLFTPLTEKNLPRIAPYLLQREERLCDWTPGLLLLWLEHFQYHYAITDGCLLLAGYYDGQFYCSYPIGDGDKAAALACLEAYCRQAGQPMRLSPTTPAQSAALVARYPQARVLQYRDEWDYLYHYADLAHFAGRHYSAQRNHIHRFERACPNWQYRPMTAGDIPAVEAFLRRFNSGRKLTADEAAEEQGLRRLMDAACAPEVLPGTRLSGGLLTVEDNMVAFSLGEITGDTLYVHVEKADTAYPGVYQMMVREYTRHQEVPGLLYINREDDAGSEGLRRSKLAYRPCALLEKETVIIDG